VAKVRFNKLVLLSKVGGANVERSVAVIDYIKKLLEEDQYKSIKAVTAYTDYDDRTLFVPVGGDGTVLAYAKDIVDGGSDFPIMGINLGKVGFLTDIQNHEAHIRTLLNCMINDEYCGFVEDRRTLLTSFSSHTGENVAMNDFVISNLYSDNIVQYELEVGESYAGMHKANGVIISTPTGSTAYAMNVGGPIIEPGLDVMQIIPIAGMGLTARPIIVSGKSNVVIRIKGKPSQTVSFKADGQECVRVENEDFEIRITQHERKATLLHFNGWNFFEKMTGKLNWNVGTF
jgi:NAD+ kinase